MKSKIALGLALALVTSACGDSRPAGPDPAAGLTPVVSTSEWAGSSPAAEGLDTARLEDLVARLRRGQYGRVSSVLVVRNGRLAVEEYFDGMVAERAHTQQSVTKSVTSMLVGLAVQSGRLSLDTRVASLFPDYQPIANLDDRKSALTVADLLTMRSGLDWSESTYAGSPLERLNLCQCDWLRFVLDWPMRDPPGTRFEYVSGGTILLGGIVGRTTGRRLDRFAADELFRPLGIAGESWFQGQPDGLPHAGGGLALRPRDMAKLGAVMLNGGNWNSQQVLHPEWIALTTTRVARGVRAFAGRPVDYGYGWWLMEYQGADVVTASGARGQWIFIVPALRLVVAATGNNEAAAAAPVDFLYTHILPGATR